MLSFDKNATKLIKGVAVLILIFHHTFCISTYIGTDVKPDTLFLSLSQLRTLGAMCRECLALFLVLSGYGMYITATKFRNIWGYSFYRLKKLLYSSFTAFIALLPIIFMVYGSLKVEIGSIEDLLLNMFGLSALFGVNTLISGWWYLSMTYILIIMFPIFYDLQNKKITGLVPFAFALCCSFLVTGWSGKTVDFNRWVLPFVCGMYLAKYDLLDKYLSKVNNRILKICSACLLGFLVIGCVFWFKSKLGPISIWETIFALVIILFSVSVLGSFKYVTNLLIWLGGISMDIFLSHMLILRWPLYYEFLYSLPQSVLCLVLNIIVCIGVGVCTKYLREFVASGVNSNILKAVA